MQLVRAFVDVRASVAEALRRWSERPSLPGDAASGTVAFQPLNETKSRVIVQLEIGQATCGRMSGFLERTRRELERDLDAFKRLLEGGERAEPRQNAADSGATPPR